MNIPFARSPSEVRVQIWKDVAIFRSQSPPSRGWKGLVTGCLNNHLGSDDNRYIVLGWLFDSSNKPSRPMSSKILEDAHWYALERWVGPYMNEGDYKINVTFPLEVALVLRQAVSEMAKTEHNNADLSITKMQKAIEALDRSEFEEEIEIRAPAPVLSILDKLREEYRR